jgi:hypothetical protein
MTEKLQLSLNLQGVECNGYPNCKITFNNSTLLDCKIVGKQTYLFSITLDKFNILIIEQYGKSFGENGIWDTELYDGKIVKDRYISILDMKMDNISLKPWWHHGKIKGDYIFEHQESIGLYKNVKYELFFESPFFSWCIDKSNEGYKEVGPSWKKSSLNSFSDGYSITSERFEELIHDAKKNLEKL